MSNVVCDYIGTLQSLQRHRVDQAIQLPEPVRTQQSGNCIFCRLFQVALPCHRQRKGRRVDVCTAMLRDSRHERLSEPSLVRIKGIPLLRVATARHVHSWHGRPSCTAC